MEVKELKEVEENNKCCTYCGKNLKDNLEIEKDNDRLKLRMELTEHYCKRQLKSERKKTDLKIGFIILLYSCALYYFNLPPLVLVLYGLFLIFKVIYGIISDYIAEEKEKRKIKERIL